jgi:hypothetical protein
MALLPIRGARSQPVTIRHSIKVPVYKWFGEVGQGFQSVTDCNVFKRLTISPFHHFTISLFQSALDFLDEHIEHFGDLNSFDFARCHFFLTYIVNAVGNFKLSQEFGHRASGDIQIGNKTSCRVSTPTFCNIGWNGCGAAPHLRG